MKGFKLFFFVLIASVLFIGQAIAGVSAIPWEWTITKSVDQSALSLTPGATFDVHYDVGLNATCPGGICTTDNIVTVSDSLKGVVLGTVAAPAMIPHDFLYTITFGPYAIGDVGQTFSYDNTASFVTNTNGVVGSASQVVSVSVVSASVPEPSTFLLLGAGLAGIGIMRKRFKK